MPNANRVAVESNEGRRSVHEGWRGRRAAAGVLPSGRALVGAIRDVKLHVHSHHAEPTSSQHRRRSDPSPRTTRGRPHRSSRARPVAKDRLRPGSWRRRDLSRSIREPLVQRYQVQGRRRLRSRLRMPRCRPTVVKLRLHSRNRAGVANSREGSFPAWHEGCLGGTGSTSDAQRSPTPRSRLPSESGRVLR